MPYKGSIFYCGHPLPLLHLIQGKTKKIRRYSLFVGKGELLHARMTRETLLKLLRNKVVQSRGLREGFLFRSSLLTHALTAGYAIEAINGCLRDRWV